MNTPTTTQPVPQAPDDGFNAIFGALPSTPLNSAATTFADKIASIGKANKTQLEKPVESNGIIGSEKNFGASIADALYSGKASDIVAKNTAAHSQSIQALADSIKELKAKGQDTSHQEQVLQEEMARDPSSYGGDVSAIIPSVNKSKEQISGEAGGVLTDLLTLSGGLSPTVAGATFGLTHALQQDKGVGGTLVDTAAGALGGKILEYGFKAVSPYISKVVSIYGAPVLEKLSQYIPESVMPALRSLAEKASIGEGTGGTDILNKVNDIAQKPFDAVESAATGANNLKNNLVEKGKKLISGKTQEEILATPEAELHKLNPSERKIYFDNAQETINTKASALEDKVKADLQTKVEASQKEAEDLTRKLAVSSRDEVLSLRPKIIKAMGEQSKTYRSLVDEELAPYADVPASISSIKDFVGSQFPDDPGKTAAVLEKLGIKEFPTKLDDTTYGEIYKQAKALKSDVSKSKIFTADDKLTDDAVNVLTRYMKKSGIDLSEANKFWAKYAPVRNQLVTEAKPFLQAPTQTKTFANTLTRVAKGTDVNNENFIGAVEDLVGSPVAVEAKKFVSQLADNEKQQLAAKVDAEVKKVSIQIEKEKATKELSDKAFEVERSTRVKTAVKSVIKTFLVSGLGVEGVKKIFTGSF